ncbi:leucine-rich repeat domain-containing protein [Legionella drancourtii]|uniref:Uncharacterized protein n=1 Tax=Legionella drancourtii LLAP12 TaxID=658187 RepID=G9EPW4_9GAMM|nr:hypothetical protein [Legionella drancourtii]EHL30666.1 hypothetical protein LDG_7305 [Legionella drancourtii LLAP12]
MKNPPNFYYQIQSKRENYTHAPSGTINVQQLMQGKPCWQGLAPLENKEKILILNDWRMNSQREDLVPIYVTILKQLLEDGFTVYIWKDQRAHLLDLESFSIYEFSMLNSMEPKKEEEIRKEAALQLSVNKNQILVLDDYWVTYLFQKITAPTTLESTGRQLSLRDYLWSSYDESKASFLSSKNQTVLKYIEKIPYTRFIIDEFDSFHPYLLKSEQLFPEATRIINITYLHIEGDEIEELMNGKILACGGIKFSQRDLQQIEVLEIGQFNEEQLTWILNQCPQLHTLSILQCSLEDFHPQAPIALPLLTSLHFKNSAYYEAKFVEDLLLHFDAQLEQLILFNCGGIDADFTQIPRLPKVRKLTLDGPDISSNNINTLIKASASQLHYLYINNDDHKLTQDTSEEYSPRNLEYLIIENMVIPQESLDGLLKFADNLKILQLRNVELTGKTPWVRYQFNNLKDFTLQNKSTFHENKAIYNIFNNKKLNFISLKNSLVMYDNNNNILNLPSLLTLELLSDVKNLNKFVNNAPQLQRLVLEGKTADFSSIPPATPHLAEIVLKQFIFFSKGMEVFLEKNINQLNEFAFTFTDEINIFPLLKRATNLKKLYFKGPKKHNVLTQDFYTDLLNSLAYLPQLEYLELEQFGNIKFKKFQEIQLAARNAQLAKLTTLTLTSTTFLDRNDFAILINLFPQIEQLLLSKTTFCDKPKPIKGTIRVLDSLKLIQLSQQLVFPTNLLKLILDASPNLQMVDLAGSTALQSDKEVMTLLHPYELQGLSEPERYDADKKTTVDADTLNKNTNYTVNVIFYNLNGESLKDEVPFYRENIFDQVIISSQQCTQSNPFELIEIKPDDLTPCSPTKIANLKNIAKQEPRPPKNIGQYVYAQDCLVLNSEWQALPSLSPEEKLQCYSLSIDLEIELAYSQKRNQYYIRSKNKQSQPVIFEFILWIPQLPQPVMQPKSSVLATARKVISSYGEGALPSTVNRSDWTGRDYLDAIRHYKVGSCRHRVIAFWDLMKRIEQAGILPPNVEMRIVYNKLHAFFEIKTKGKWHIYDLGGYESGIEFIEPTFHEEPAIEKKVEEEPSLVLYKSYFNTRVTPSSEITSVLHYCQQLIQRIDASNQKNGLISLNSTDEMASMALQLERFCQATSRPVLFINHPDDLIESSVSIQREGSKGTLKQKSGGALANFFSKNQEETALIIINYDEFSLQDLLMSIAVLDRKQKNILLIGLVNPRNANHYNGADFHGYFDIREQSNFAMQVLNENLPPLRPQLVAEESSETVVLNLYKRPDWRRYLLGGWEISGVELTFKEGVLNKAIKACRQTQRPLEIRNGTWEDKDFVLFWRQALIHHRIDLEGESLILPEDFSLVRQDGYSWEYLTQGISVSHGLQAGKKVLNRATYDDFFIRYTFSNQNLKTESGILKAAHNSVLELSITGTLTLEEWTLFLHECQQNQIQLHCDLADGIELPEEMKHFLKIEPPRDTAIKPLLPWLSIYETPDPDLFIASLMQEQNYRVVDISECNSADLLKQRKGEIKKDGSGFCFEERDTFIPTSIAAGIKIILKGQFSSSLADALTAYFLENELPDNSVTLVTEDSQHFSCLPIKKVALNNKLKYQHLRRHYKENELFSFSSEVFAQKSVAQLIACLNYARRESKLAQHETEFNLIEQLNSDLAWQGMHGIIGGIQRNDFDYVNSAEHAQAFIQKRIDAFKATVKYSPFVFFTGLTGVGKTTFVTHILKDKGYCIHESINNLSQWINDCRPGQKILFLDEANLDPSQWSLFEGLFNEPPAILYNGTYHLLSTDHKVIFAGNPLNYGAGRQLASLFSRHGSALQFEPLSQNFIYEKIIKPVFSGTIIEGESQKIAKEILAVYQYVCEHSLNEVLMSPREIKTMALFTLINKLQNPMRETKQIAASYAFSLGKYLIPDYLYPQFKENFATQLQVNDSIHTLNSDRFLLTSSRREAHQLLSDFLNTRNLSPSSAGCLGGFILEAEPKEGSTSLVINTLKSLGYIKESKKRENSDQPTYYVLPSNISLARREEILRKAFHEGSVVIIKGESSLQESLLNALLMERTPEGELAAKSGFRLIILQKSTSQDLSKALQRRLLKCRLPTYSLAEMLAILAQKGVPEEKAKHLIKAYLAQREEAKIKRLSPEPAFSDLLKAAKLVLKSMRSKESVYGKRAHEEEEDEQLLKPKNLTQAKKRTKRDDDLNDEMDIEPPSARRLNRAQFFSSAEQGDNDDFEVQSPKPF